MKKLVCEMCNSTDLVKQDGQWVCQSCGLKYTPDGISIIENDLERGKQCLSVSDWDTAYKVYSEAVTKDAVNFKAWFGCLNAMTHYFTSLDFTRYEKDGIMGLESVIRHCLKYASKDQQQKLINELQFWGLCLKQEQEKHDIVMKRPLKIKGWIWVCVGLLSITAETGSLLRVLAFVPLGYGIWCFMKAGMLSSDESDRASAVVDKIENAISHICNKTEALKDSMGV